MIPVVLCGGSGTRLWPLSRKLFPKQFHSLFGQRTLIQETVSRLIASGCSLPPVIICNEEHRFMVAGQMDEINQTPENIILEHVCKGTGPAVAVAARFIESKFGDQIMGVFPADHIIANGKGFTETLGKASKFASDGDLVTFGITPKRPDTGYGYIRLSEPLTDSAGIVSAFIEKPSFDSAEKFFSDGNYFWNSGMFCFRASRIIRDFKRFAPEILDHVDSAIEMSTIDGCFLRLDSERFNQCPSDSIDYAIMEKVLDSRMVKLDAEWDDVGSWSSIWSCQPKDNYGNVKQGNVLLKETSDSLIVSNHSLAAAIGLENLIIINTPDALLVANRDQIDMLKEVVAELLEKGSEEVIQHRTVYRPWGSFNSIDRGERFQVKRIIVDPFKKLSLQSHKHRAEHWVVVRGQAEVTIDNSTFTLCENQSTYISPGTIHRLANHNSTPLEIIEIQSGDYLGEDDIERIEDEYNR